MGRLIWEHRWWLIVPALIAFAASVALIVADGPSPDEPAIPLHYDLPAGEP